MSPAVLAVMRASPEGDRVAVTLTNVTKFKHRVEIPLEEMNGYKGHWQDLLSEKENSRKKIVTLPALDRWQRRSFMI
jgi:hypothetical protein